MSVNVIRINGNKIHEAKTFIDEVKSAAKEAEEAIMKEANREVRRSKMFQRVMLIVGSLGASAIICAGEAQAMPPEGLNPITAPRSLGTFLIDAIIQKATNGKGIQLDRDRSMSWSFIKYMNDTFFKTENVFENPSILHFYHVVFYVVLSFTTLMVAKKGWDMAKAKILGSNSQSLPEFFTRLIASIVMSFLSLKVIEVGIDISNLFVKVLTDNLAKGVASYNSVGELSIAYGGSMVWTIAFSILFVILAIKYWARQINLMIMGMMAPIANMSWVTDGGQLLGTLVREIIVNLTTPIVQMATMALSTLLLFEVNSKIANGTFAFYNAVFISLSTMCIMITTPHFLQKFVAGTFNPLSFAFKTFATIKGLPVQFLKFMK